DVIDKASAAGEQRRILLALDACAEPFCAHHRCPRAEACSALDLAHRRFRPQPGARPGERLLAGVLPGPAHGARSINIPALDPVAERLAVPWRLETDRRQVELLPERQRALHEFL